MPAIALEAFRQTPGLVFYLDTSAIFPLAYKNAGAISGLEADRFRRLSPFIDAVNRAGSRCIATVLGLEEFAGVVRNSRRQSLAKRANCNSWYDYAQANRAAADAEVPRIQAHVLAMLQHAANEMGALNVSVEQPLADDAKAVGKQLRKSHRLFLSRYATIDSMDALHMAFGLALHSEHFISFDNQWKQVLEFAVLY
jgi:hypothetical protein